jgi:hypothetical protein
MHEGGEKCFQNFNHLEDVGVDARIILKRILKHRNRVKEYGPDSSGSG